MELYIRTALVISLIAIGLGFLFVKAFLNYWRLRHIPGPWLASFSPLWLAYHTLKGNVIYAGEDALRKYGPLVRISPNIVMHHDPEFRKFCLAPRSPFIRGDWYDGMKLDPRQHNVFSMQDEKLHSVRRGMLKPGYTGKEIPALESDMDSVLLDSFKNLQGYVERNEKFDYAVLISYFTVDVLCKIGFSREGGFTKHNRDNFDFFKTSADFFPLLELSLNVPLIKKILTSRPVQWLAGAKPSDKVGLGAIMGLAHEEVATRFLGHDEKDHNDMLDSFIRHGLGREECEVESALQIMAGADSTATALRNIFWYILSCPRTYRKLDEEIKAAVEAGNISWPIVKYEEAKELRYLNACIKEGTRIFMPLTGIAAMAAPEEGYTFNGVFIPGGTQVGMNYYAMLRREDIFGPDADTFRPERFLDDEPAKIKRYEQVQELVFGSGRFQCLGRQIAMIELRKMLFELFRRYDYTVVDPLRAVHVASHGIVVQRKMYVRAHSKLES